MAVSIRQSSFSGPIPPPDLLRGYNDVLTNGADRIMKMAEDQSAHRIALEKSTIKEQQRQGSMGQIFGFVIGIVGLLVAGYCAISGHDAVGGLIGTVDLVGLVGLFVIGKYRQNKDLEGKREV